MEIILIIIGIAAGAVIGYLFARSVSSNVIQAERIKYAETDREFAAFKARMENEVENVQKQMSEKQQEIQTVVEKMAVKDQLLGEQNVKIAEKEAEIKTLKEKLDTLKAEIDKIGEKYAAEFKNLANEILEDKSQRFTQKNKENLEAILKPLDDNIREFKKTVSDAYQTEAKERFSLGNEVKKLAELNQQMSEEARNLTRALKGEAETQGDWGEMILESILEKSGLVKGREYFLEHQLTDENNKVIFSEFSGKKMRPDAVIKYPDERNVIIDSKVSLTAFTELVDETDSEIYATKLNQHLASVKNHIQQLSQKAYDDYGKSLDFVMMFIPSEPAYIAAMQADSNLWNYAYERRILLLNPSNLITSLKLIADLWKREYQSRNAMEIAERGAKLYDKFVGFVENLEKIGKNIDNAKSSYNDAYKQLSTGNDNLIVQTQKLRALGIKNKKQLPNSLSEEAANQIDFSEE